MVAAGKIRNLDLTSAVTIQTKFVRTENLSLPVQLAFQEPVQLFPIIFTNMAQNGLNILQERMTFQMWICSPNLSALW